MMPRIPSSSVATTTSVTIASVATELCCRSTCIPNPPSVARDWVKPQPLVVERRLRTDKWIVDLEDPPVLQIEPLDLLLLVFEEDPIVRSVLDHRHHSLACSGCQMRALVSLGEPEIHGQRVVEQDVWLDAQIGHCALSRFVFAEHLNRRPQEDVEPFVDKHREQAVIVRAGDDLQPVALEDVDIDPSEPQPKGELRQIGIGPDRVESGLILLADEEDAVAAEVFVHG